LHTSHTSIIRVARAEIIGPYSLTGAPGTVNESCLRSSAEQVIQEDGTSTTAKVCIAEYCSTYTKGKGSTLMQLWIK